MTKRLWIEADYFNKFQCKCGACKRSCCSSFVVPVSKKEYYKLLTLPCSKKLCDKIESCFVEPEFPTEDRYRLIAPNYLGDCPMLDENGLCMIHKELGPSALSSICNTYPRSLKQINNHFQANCSNSCEAVVELLFNQDKVNFVEAERNDEPNLFVKVSDDYSNMHIDFTNIIQDRNFPLNKRLEKICSHLNINPTNANCVGAFKEVANFIEKVSVNSPIYEDFITALRNRYTIDENGYRLFKEDEKQFEQNYPKWMIYFENVIVNHLYFVNVPYVDERLDKKDCTKGLCLLYGLMKIICSCLTLQDHSLEQLVYVVSDIFHLVEHTSFYYNAFVLIKDETSILNI